MGDLGKGEWTDWVAILFTPFCPLVQADQLLCGYGPSSSSSRLVQLAALGEGLDYVADAIVRLLGHRGAGGPEDMPTGVARLVERCAWVHMWGGGGGRGQYAERH